jgi:hypothetical protein
MVEEHHKSFYDVVYVSLLSLLALHFGIHSRVSVEKNRELYGNKKFISFLKHTARERHNELDAFAM